MPSSQKSGVFISYARGDGELLAADLRRRLEAEGIPLWRDREREEPVAITAALRAAGGYGKTMLARAVCRDEDVQNAFDDGILWVTLGEDPGDLTRRVEDLIDRRLRVGDATSGALRLILSGHIDDVTACAVSPDGQFIVSAVSEDETLRIWDVKTGSGRYLLAFVFLSAF